MTGAAGLRLVRSLAFIVLCAVTVHPLAATGRGLVVAILLVLSTVLLLLRDAPRRRPPDSAQAALLIIAGVAAVALIAVSRTGTGYLFAFLVAGHAGYRFSARPAIAIAAAMSVLSAAVLLLGVGGDHDGLPWYVGAATGVSVLLGMVNRSSQQALNSAVAAARSAEQATRSAERAAQAEAREAVLAERGRIARDVHDVLAHSLAGINMQLEVADALLDVGDIERVRQATRRAQSLVRESLIESSRTLQALREDVLPLVQTLTAMLESFGHDDSLEVVGRVRDIDTSTAQNLVRIAQESLTNAARYAAGARVKLTLTFDPATVSLDVCNEAGVRPAADGGSGMGLVGIRERAALLGGTVSAGPIADSLASESFAGGWRVAAVIPA